MTHQQKLIFWVIWFGIFGSLFIYKFTLGSGFQSVSEAAPIHNLGLAIPLVLFIGTFAMSLFVRLMIVPRSRNFQLLLASFIIGLVLAESTLFYAIFLAPQLENALFLFSVLAVLVYLPSHMPLIHGDKDSTTPLR